jgi:pimeloyl-ACP methyl ester carboxylesterase
MLNFFSNSSETLEDLKTAEAKLIEYAKGFGGRHPDSFDIKVKDTPLDPEALPIKECKKKKYKDFHLHSVSVQSNDAYCNNNNKKSTPLVLMHGYMNGAMYFYRNLVGLSHYFDTVYSLDTLGSGLSSRCPDLLKSDAKDSSTETTEAIFVESLEQWRKANNIPKMILAGHSIGAYIGVAYCERYPENVEQLVLLSPAGVTQADPEETQNFVSHMSWSQRIVVGGVRSLFDFGVTPAGFFRSFPSRLKSMIESYVDNRLPSIKNPQEKQVLAHYLYSNAVLPGSAEDMLNRFLTSSAHGKVPTVDRIPKLKVPKVSFIYGDRDWMDVDGGIEVWNQSKMLNDSPIIDVYRMQNAGHLLMLDNYRGFHAGLVTMCGGRSTLPSSHFPMPATIRAASS